MVNDSEARTANAAPQNVGISGLKPPDKMQNLTAEGFKRWKQQFEFYHKASGANKKESEIQVALLLHCMGEECIEIYNTFTYETPNLKDDYKTVFGKFEEYFIPKKNESVSSHIFFTRNQHTGETFDAFVTDLKKLSVDCNFGTLKDRLIRDRIVAGINDTKLKDRLLREIDLDLEKTVKICKAAEMASEQVKQFGKGMEVSAIKKQRATQGSQNKIQSTSRNQQQQKFAEAFSARDVNSGNDQRQKKACQRCGYKHAKMKCPAYRQTCKVCQKYNHFASQCRERKTVKLVNVEEKYDDINDELEEVFVNVINTRKKESNNGWYEEVEFIESKAKVLFKLDTGAECNVIPLSICKRLGLIVTKSKNIIKNYDEREMAMAGKVDAQCKVRKNGAKLCFEVHKNNHVPVLGFPTINKLKLAVRVETKSIDSIKVETNSLLNKYKDVFQGLGEIKGYKYEIKLKKDAQGKIEPCRHVPFKMKDKLKIELDRMEKENIISKVDKPTEYVNSLVVTTKSDKSLRVCLDPRHLNKQIQREHLQLPTVDEITVNLTGSKIFTTLDANRAFWQIVLSEDTREYTTFNTPFGRYYFNRMPYGLSSSPEIFHRIFKDIFKDIEGVEIYVDDILIKATNEVEHDIILEKVLKRAQKCGIKFNLKKCQIKSKEVKYIGRIISAEGVKMDDDKIKAIIEMDEPKTVTELQRFLGMINYVSPFLPKASDLTAPLRNLIKKNVPYIWGKEQKGAYEIIKKRLVEPPVLAFFEVDKPIVLSVDASKQGLGSVILQNGRPIAYGSRSLTETEQNYSQIEKEALAIWYGCNKFHQYLFAQTFTVETDHKPLVSIINKPLNKCPARLQRIMLSLQQYDFKLIYKSGKELLVADHLSRSYLKNEQKSYEIQIEAHVATINSSYNITDKRLNEIANETSKDIELISVIKYIKNGWPNNKSEVENEARLYFSYRDELTVDNGIVYKGMQIVIPKILQKQMLNRIHYAHLGIEKCKMLARKTLFWPMMSKHIEDCIEKCDICKKYQRMNSKESMICKEIPEKPWKILAADIFHLYGKDYIIVVDSYSKYVEIERLHGISADSIINTLKAIFARHGIPETLYSDSGTQYENAKFAKFSNEWNFSHKIISPKHHQGNGLAERFIQTVKRILKKIIDTNRDTNMALLILRNTPVNSLGQTPAELLFNRTVKSVLPGRDKKLSKNDAHYEILKANQEKQKLYYDKGSKHLKELKENEIVKISNENRRLPNESAMVLKKGENERSYIVKLENGQVLKRNRKMLISGGTFNEKFNDYIEPEIVESKIVNEDNQTSPSSVSTTQSRMMNEKPNDQTILSSSQNEYRTRSGRISKKPSYLNDFV